MSFSSSEVMARMTDFERLYVKECKISKAQEKVADIFLRLNELLSKLNKIMESHILKLGENMAKSDEILYRNFELRSHKKKFAHKFKSHPCSKCERLAQQIERLEHEYAILKTNIKNSAQFEEVETKKIAELQEELKIAQKEMGELRSS